MGLSEVRSGRHSYLAAARHPPGRALGPPEIPGDLAGA